MFLKKTFLATFLRPTEHSACSDKKKAKVLFICQNNLYNVLLVTGIDFRHIHKKMPLIFFLEFRDMKNQFIFISVMSLIFIYS